LIDAWIVAFSLILVRVSLFVGMLPLFGGRNLPRIVKVGMSVGLATMWFCSFGVIPSLFVFEMSAGSHWLGFLLAIGREALFGAMLGFAFGLFLLPARIAGAYVAQEMGLNLAAISDPSAQDSATVLAQMFEALGILLFFGLDFHHVILSALHLTFIRWPVGSPISAFPTVPLMNGMVHAQEWGLLLAAPMAICLFLTVVALTLMMKVAPQLNLFSIGLTLRIGAGLLAVLFFLPDVCLLMQQVFNQMSQLVYDLI